jgi:hypothetical protein
MDRTAGHHGTTRGVFRKTGGTARHRRRPHVQKVLIANRGAIACRMIRTPASRWACASVAVYSEADADSCTWPGRRAICIGPARPPRATWTRQRSSTPPAATGAGPSTPATASCPKTRTSPRPARPPASPSSAPPRPDARLRPQAHRPRPGASPGRAPAARQRPAS